MRNLLERNLSIHELESSATQATLVRKVRDVGCCPSVKLRPRQHFSGQLRLLKMDEGSACSIVRFDPCGPSPDVILFQQFRLEVYRHELVGREGHRLWPREEERTVDCRARRGEIREPDPVG